jgi:hypothetical protein
MAVWAYLTGVGGIRRLGVGALWCFGTGVKARELAVELFDLSHQFWVEPSDLDARVSKA